MAHHDKGVVNMCLRAMRASTGMDLERARCGPTPGQFFFFFGAQDIFFLVIFTTAAQTAL